VVGLGRRGDVADGSDGDGRLATDALGEAGLVAGADRDLGAQSGAARRDIEEIDAQPGEAAGELDTLVGGPAAGHPVGRGQPQAV
jgi:hypothetical protein